MPIERNNSFHLMLSEDELTLLKMLAEQKGVNASDYLRLLIREGGHSSSMAHVYALQAMMEKGSDVRETFEKARAAAAKTRKR
jgi:hypothetical protein